MSKNDVCMECRSAEIDRENHSSFCSECFSTLKGTWRKMDELDLYWYVR